MFRKSRKYGQSSVARRHCAERSKLLHPVLGNVVSVRVGGETFCSLGLQRNEARVLHQRGDCLQLLSIADPDGVETSLLGRWFEGAFRGPSTSAPKLW